MKFTPRPMAPEFAHRSQRHVEPLLRPLPTPTRVVTVRPYLHPEVRWTPEIPPAPPLTSGQKSAVTRAKYAAIRGRCPAAEKGVQTRRVNLATRARALEEAKRRHPRYDSPEFSASNA